MACYREERGNSNRVANIEGRALSVLVPTKGFQVTMLNIPG